MKKRNKKQGIKIVFPEEIGGNYAWMLTWIGAGNFLSTRHFSYKKEAIDQYLWLRKLRIKKIAIYRFCEIEEETNEIHAK